MSNDKEETVAAEGEDNFERNEQIVDDGAIKRAGQTDDAPDALGETRLGEMGVDIAQATDPHGTGRQ